MKNTEVFCDYDMVVCMTEKTINDQLLHLAKMGIIKSELILVQTIAKNDYVYEVLDSSADIPMEPDGTPTWSYIDGIYIPQVKISESGSNITFILNFQSGTAYFWDGEGRRANLVPYDMTGWTYGIVITLDLKAVEKDDIGKKIKVPDLVKDQLYHFMSSMFSVNHLFMDFESVDLMRFDPAHTDSKGSGDIGLKQLASFMQFYLADLVKKGNPYILGYSLTTTDHTNYDPDQSVPDLLRPVGTTFSLYHDPNHPELSNLNFVLGTKGGHGSKLGTPGNFDTNWISPAEQCDAKMIYSHKVLAEALFLKPMFEQVRSGVYAQIKDNISVAEGNDYDAAKTTTSTGYNYGISNIAAGDDQYVNSMSASFSSDATTASIAINGHMSFYKEIHKDMGLCNAEADASGSLDWNTKLTFSAAKDAKGEPTLKVDKTPMATPNHTQDSHQNDCAKGFEVIGKILGKLLDALTGMLDKGLFSKLLAKVFDTPIPGIGDVGTAIGNVGNSVSTVVVLPAGQVFFFKNPSIDTEGNLALQLTYKSEN